MMRQYFIQKQTSCGYTKEKGVFREKKVSLIDDT